jgi:probable phosphoglycerate mutase
VTLRSRRSGIVLVAALMMAATFITTGLGTADARPGNGPRSHEILFIRHAEASPANGPLSELGLTQAAALATLLHDAPVEFVDTSMLARAFQTGAAVASDHDLTLTADERINEVTFDLTGIAPADINTVVGGRLRTWLIGEQRDNSFGPAGESFNQVQARFDAWWADYLREHRHDWGTDVVVAHGALMILMLPEVCANHLDPDFVLGHPLLNTSIVKARLARDGTLTCTEWAGAPIPSAATVG